MQKWSNLSFFLLLILAVILEKFDFFSTFSCRLWYSCNSWDSLLTGERRWRRIHYWSMPGFRDRFSLNTGKNEPFSVTTGFRCWSRFRWQGSIRLCNAFQPKPPIMAESEKVRLCDALLGNNCVMFWYLSDVADLDWLSSLVVCIGGRRDRNIYDWSWCCRSGGSGRCWCVLFCHSRLCASVRL